MGTRPYPNPQAFFTSSMRRRAATRWSAFCWRCFWARLVFITFICAAPGWVILYCCFFWSGIPAILGFIECFFMPGRVREFNAIQAAGIAAALGIPVPGWGQPVNRVGMPAGRGAGAGDRRCRRSKCSLPEDGAGSDWRGFSCGAGRRR